MSQKYTAILIPDHDGETRRFRVSGLRLKGAIAGIFLLIIAVIATLFYYIPRSMEFESMKSQYEQFAAERSKVLELSRDLERIEQMDQLIRNSLGTPRKVNLQELTLIEKEDKKGAISYFENIPSVPPITGYISRRADQGRSFIQRGHFGIDIVVKEGEPVQASAAGLVVFSDWTYDQGNVIILYHGDGYFTHYGHNQQNLKNQREMVTRGEVIALSGNTGHSSGPHLHFEIWKDGEAVDPLDYFPSLKEKDLTSKNG